LGFSALCHAVPCCAMLCHAVLCCTASLLLLLSSSFFSLWSHHYPIIWLDVCLTSHLYSVSCCHAADKARLHARQAFRFIAQLSCTATDSLACPRFCASSKRRLHVPTGSPCAKPLFCSTTLIGLGLQHLLFKSSSQCITLPMTSLVSRRGSFSWFSAESEPKIPSPSRKP